MVNHPNRRRHIIRYVVTYVPTDAVTAAAYRAGMKDDDGSSVWDWVDENDYERVAEPVYDFSEAINLARSFIAYDIFEEVSVTRQILHRMSRRESWERDAIWLVYDTGQDVREDDPDHICERLVDDEEE